MATDENEPFWMFVLRVVVLGSSQMQRWIDQAKDKLLDIIAMTKEDVANISLRVAFVG